MSQQANYVLFRQISISQLPVDEDLSQWLLTSYVVTTCLLVGLSGFVIMVTAFILPYIKANEELDSVLSETGLDQKYHYHRKYTLERRLRDLIQLTWLLASTGSVFLFTLDVILLCWIKFSHSSKAVPGSATAVLTPLILILLLFGLYFRRRLMNNKLFDTVQNEEDDDDDDEQPRRAFKPYNWTKRKISDASVRIAMAVLGIKISMLPDPSIKQNV